MQRMTDDNFDAELRRFLTAEAEQRAEDAAGDIEMFDRVQLRVNGRRLSRGVMVLLAAALLVTTLVAGTILAGAFLKNPSLVVSSPRPSSSSSRLPDDPLVGFSPCSLLSSGLVSTIVGQVATNSYQHLSTLAIAGFTDCLYFRGGDGLVPWLGAVSLRQESTSRSQAGALAGSLFPEGFDEYPVQGSPHIFVYIPDCAKVAGACGHLMVFSAPPYFFTLRFDTVQLPGWVKPIGPSASLTRSNVLHIAQMVAADYFRSPSDPLVGINPCDLIPDEVVIAALGGENLVGEAHLPTTDFLDVGFWNCIYFPVARRDGVVTLIPYGSRASMSVRQASTSLAEAARLAGELLPSGFEQSVVKTETGQTAKVYLSGCDSSDALQCRIIIGIAIEPYFFVFRVGADSLRGSSAPIDPSDPADRDAMLALARTLAQNIRRP